MNREPPFQAMPLGMEDSPLTMTCQGRAQRRARLGSALECTAGQGTGLRM